MSMRKTGLTPLAAVFGTALLLGSGTTAHALSITYSDATGCGGSTCFGSVYSLDVQSGGGNLYNVTYTVNTSGYTGAGSGLDAIAFKITDNTSNVLSTSITSQPLTFSDPLLVGGLSANGCASGSCWVYLQSVVEPWWACSAERHLYISVWGNTCEWHIVR